MSWSAMGGDSLTKSEAEVLGLVDSGLSNREIAATLSITVGTVKCHLHRVYEKLQVSGRLQAVAKVREFEEFSSRVRRTASLHAPVLPSKIGFGR